MANPDGRVETPPLGLGGVSVNEVERVLAPLIAAWERVLNAQGAQFQAMSGRIDQIAKSLDEDRKQTVAVLDQARAVMEVAEAVITAGDEKLDQLTEVTLALQTIYEEQQGQGQQEGEEQ